MPTTTNFGWTTPADTDLVKDGASAMRTLANGIDTSMAQLKGGTTGQILSKTSNTDMAFTWINNDQGDITAVTAGTGLTGGGTTGSVTVSLDSPVSATLGGTAQTTYATGDLLYASGTNTLAKRTIGTSGQVLTVSGGVPVWATAAGGGKVLQVVYATSTTQTSISSTSYTDTGLSGSITPSATSSKVLVLIAQNVVFSMSANSGGGGAVQLLRGSTSVLDLDGGSSDVIWFRTGLGNPNNVYAFSLPVFYLDSPNTTSSTTYKTQAKLGSTSNSANLTFQNDSVDSVMILMEIGA